MKYKIFAKSKDGVYVDYIYSTFFKDYEQGDILIKEGSTIEFIHHGMNVYDSNMCHNYKIENGKVVETTQEDKLLELSSRHQEPPEIEVIQNKISILECENEALKEELTQIQTSIASLTSLITATLEEK